ncbi:MAG: aminopeptidase [Firmicutes bacterium]|nr:aminopeptidase [Bacillota bacterium]
MRDPRVTNMAKVLVHYSLGIKPGDFFVIRSGEVATPLIKAVYEEALQAGAHPEVQIRMSEINEIFLKNANDEQLQYVSSLTRIPVEEADACLTILGEVNVRALSGVDPARQALRSRATSELTNTMMKRAAAGEYRWCLTQFPTNADAQEANMSLSEYEDFVFEACGLNEEDPVAYWQRIDAEQEELIKRLDSVETLHIVGEDTDLTLNTGGRRWKSCSGKSNFPDGEIFTGPVEDSANGYIRFSFPGIFRGQLIEDIRLRFEDGKVVSAAARHGEKLLHALLDTDPGARYLGELGIGTNYAITRHTRNMLFDEKIGGTVHLALGAAYPATGSRNESAIHWDMLCDLRSGGEIYADGQLIYKDGKFTF